MNSLSVLKGIRIKSNETKRKGWPSMKIMAALDLSDYANFVLIKAIKTAKQQNAKLDIVVVVEEQGDGPDSVDCERTEEHLLQEADLAARFYQKKALEQGVKAKVRLLSGKSVAEAIIQYQQSEKLDLIVIGRRSRKQQGSYPIGAVAQQVAAYATSSVMVVRCMEERDRMT